MQRKGRRQLHLYGQTTYGVTQNRPGKPGALIIADRGSPRRHGRYYKNQACVITGTSYYRYIPTPCVHETHIKNLTKNTHQSTHLFYCEEIHISLATSSDSCMYICQISISQKVLLLPILRKVDLASFAHHLTHRDMFKRRGIFMLHPKEFWDCACICACNPTISLFFVAPKPCIQAEALSCLYQGGGARAAAR